MTSYILSLSHKKMEWEGITIQEMETQDLEEVLFIEKASSLAPWSLQLFIEELQNPNAHCFVLKREEGFPPTVIGFICFHNVGEESELFNISVHPAFRQWGYGKKLMQRYLDFCHGLGIRTFYLEVPASNRAAIHLYQIFGYEYFGRRKKFYRGKFDALLFKKKA